MKLAKQIIKIDENLCTGCEICANTCHQSAIKIVNGKAKLFKEDFCDGFGRCLKKCPQDAITFITIKTKANKLKELKELKKTKPSENFSCLSTRSLNFNTSKSTDSFRIKNWPIQIKLVPTKADYYDNADLLVAADCTSFAYANIHNDFMKGKVVLIGCPKLDAIEYQEKLTQILTLNNINSITLLKMEVPCCTGLEYALKQAILNSKKDIHVTYHTVTISGKIT